MSKGDTEHPILIRTGPKSGKDAIDNLYAFSDEARQSPHIPDGTPPPPFPPLPVCYGWTTVKRHELPVLDPPIWKEVDGHLDWHWAVVYEVVPKANQDLAVGQIHLDFFYAVGFALEPYKPDNWHGGRLVDLNDICSAFSIGWRWRAVCSCKAEEFFWTLDVTESYYPFKDRKIVRQASKPARRLDV